jgi:hypothetical protein
MWDWDRLRLWLRCRGLRLRWSILISHGRSLNPWVAGQSDPAREVLSTVSGLRLRFFGRFLPQILPRFWAQKSRQNRRRRMAGFMGLYRALPGFPMIFHSSAGFWPSSRYLGHFRWGRNGAWVRSNRGCFEISTLQGLSLFRALPPVPLDSGHARRGINHLRAQSNGTDRMLGS